VRRMGCSDVDRLDLAIHEHRRIAVEDAGARKGLGEARLPGITRGDRGEPPGLGMRQRRRKGPGDRAGSDDAPGKLVCSHGGPNGFGGRTTVVADGLSRNAGLTKPRIGVVLARRFRMGSGETKEEEWRLPSMK